MRIALVGAGGMGTCHYMNYRHIEGAQVVALVGRGERDRAHAEQWGLPLYTCVDEANRREQIDLFDVCVPTYLHKAIVLEALACGVPVLVQGDVKKGFVTEAEDLAPYVTERTKALILNSPNNPNGCIWNREQLAGIAKLAVEKGFYVVSDEIYEKLIYDGARHFSVASVSEEVRRRTVTVNGFSKAFAMPGWRLGYMAAAGDVAKAVADIQGHMTSAPNSIAQKAALAGLTGPQDAVEAMRAEYQRRRDFACEALRAMPGVELVKPRGAFYLFPRVTALYGARRGKYRVDSSRDLADYLLEEAKIAVVFGEAFFAPGYLRLSYATSMDLLKEALRRMADALARLRR